MRAAAADTDDQVSSDTHVAVVDDDADVATLLVGYLRSHGFRVTSLRDGASLLALMPVDPPALVLLDLGLPGEDGLSIAGKLRAQWRCGLVIVTGRGDAVDKVVGLELGADDYLAKPFGPRELLARVRAVLRRGGEGTTAARPAAIAFGPYRLEVDTRVLVGPEGEIALTGGEFELLRIFADHPNHVLSRDHLITLMKGYERGPFDRSVDVRVARLRRKIEPDPEAPVFLRTVWGEGYLFSPGGKASP